MGLKIYDCWDACEVKRLETSLNYINIFKMGNNESNDQNKRLDADAIIDQKVKSIMPTKDFQSLFKY